MRLALGIIGGTGFYRFLPDAEQVGVDTPYGSPSAPVSVAKIGDRAVGFIPRHGPGHEYLPSEVPYRANLWALRELGATQVIGCNTVGSLQPGIRKGDFVLCDQFVDRTWGRADTIFGRQRERAHISTAEPYCTRLRELATGALREGVGTVHPAGTVVVIQGPRFSTRAESAWFTSMGWHVINMTQYPEAPLARELELCYLNVSYVTDYDVAAKEIVRAEGEPPVSHHGVVRAFSLAEARMQEVLRRLVEVVPATADCDCRHALESARV